MVEASQRQVFFFKIFSKNFQEEAGSQVIIGIPARPLNDAMRAQTKAAEDEQFFIDSAYVDFLGQSGAKVVPLLISDSQELTKYKLQSLNGILFTGGSKVDDTFRAFCKAAIKQARRQNKEGNYFPLWGTCLGFQYLCFFESGKQIRSEFFLDRPANDICQKLEFLIQPENTKLFKNFGEKAQEFQEQELAWNHHAFGIDPQVFREEGSKLAKEYDLISVSIDTQGQEYVSAVEAKNLPFYGVQFHPEKAAVKTPEGKNIDHSEENIERNKIFSDFFASEARKSGNKFEKATVGLLEVESVEQLLIGNYRSVENMKENGRLFYLFK